MPGRSDARCSLTPRRARHRDEHAPGRASAPLRRGEPTAREAWPPRRPTPRRPRCRSRVHVAPPRWRRRELGSPLRVALRPRPTRLAATPSGLPVLRRPPGLPATAGSEGRGSGTASEATRATVSARSASISSVRAISSRSSALGSVAPIDERNRKSLYESSPRRSRTTRSAARASSSRLRAEAPPRRRPARSSASSTAS